jgi:hypothetical protein
MFRQQADKHHASHVQELNPAAAGRPELMRTMPVFSGRLTDEPIADLIAHLHKK